MNIEVNAKIYAATEEQLRTAFFAAFGNDWMLTASKKSFHILSHAYTADRNAMVIAELAKLEKAAQ